MSEISRSEFIAILADYGSIVSFGPNKFGQDIMVFKFHKPLTFSSEGHNVYDTSSFSLKPFDIEKDNIGNFLFTTEFAIFKMKSIVITNYCATKLHKLITNIIGDCDGIDLDLYFLMRETIFGIEYHVHNTRLDVEQQKTVKLLFYRAFFHSLCKNGIAFFLKDKILKITLDNALEFQYC